MTSYQDWWATLEEEKVNLKEDIDKCNKVFVYGTLRAGMGNHGVLRGAVRHGDVHTTNKEYLMTTVGIPYVIEEVPKLEGFEYEKLLDLYKPFLTKISGEVYDFNEYNAQALDTLEGHPWHYERKIIDTSAGKCWIYFESKPAIVRMLSRRLVPTGDYINQHLKNKEENNNG